MAFDLTAAGDELTAQQRSWRFQKFGLVGLVLLFVLALTGLFGRGLVSAVTHESGPIQISHQRFARVGTPERLLIEARTGAFTRVSFNADFASAVRIDTVWPTPAGSGLSRDSLDLLFLAPPRRKVERVIVDYTPDRPGLLKMRVTVDERDPVWITQFVYP